MRLTLPLCAGLVVSACASDYSTRPTPPPPQVSPSVWVIVFKGHELECLPATIEVVGGQRTGQRRVQEAGYCDPWEGIGGVTFRDLELGVAMTIRASAPGYQPQERTVIPSSVAQQGIITFSMIQAP